MKNKIVIYSVILFIFGFIASGYILKSSEEKLKAIFLTQALYVANALDIEKIKELDGDIGDQNKSAYIYLNEQLRHIRISNTTCKFLYIIGRKKTVMSFFMLTHN